MKKKLLFNYCVLKFAQKEQELKSRSDAKTALLSLTFDHRELFRRTISGCYMQDICFADVLFPEALLFLICLEAHTNGDNLLDKFDFVAGYPHHIGSWDDRYVEDRELSDYLENKLFPEVRSAKEIDFKVYSELSGLELTKDNVLNKFFHYGNLRRLKNVNLPVPEQCAETEMIDRAFDSLSSKIKFNRLLSSKHDQYGRSYLQTMFCKLPQIKKASDENPFRFNDFSNLSLTNRLKKLTS